MAQDDQDDPCPAFHALNLNEWSVVHITAMIHSLSLHQYQENLRRITIQEK